MNENKRGRKRNRAEKEQEAKVEELHGNEMELDNDDDDALEDSFDAEPVRLTKKQKKEHRRNNKTRWNDIVRVLPFDRATRFFSYPFRARLPIGALDHSFVHSPNCFIIYFLAYRIVPLF